MHRPLLDWDHASLKLLCNTPCQLGWTAQYRKWMHALNSLVFKSIGCSTSPGAWSRSPDGRLGLENPLFLLYSIYRDLGYQTCARWGASCGLTQNIRAFEKGGQSTNPTRYSNSYQHLVLSLESSAETGAEIDAETTALAVYVLVTRTSRFECQRGNGGINHFSFRSARAGPCVHIQYMPGRTQIGHACNLLILVSLTPLQCRRH